MRSAILPDWGSLDRLVKYYEAGLLQHTFPCNKILKLRQANVNGTANPTFKMWHTRFTMVNFQLFLYQKWIIFHCVFVYNHLRIFAAETMKEIVWINYLSHCYWDTGLKAGYPCISINSFRFDLVCLYRLTYAFL